MKNFSGVLILAGMSMVSAGNSRAAEPAEIPFKLCRGYAVVVVGSIGERTELNFLIDTGAVPSVINARLSRKLGLVGTADSISALSQSVSVQRVLLADVRLGPLSAALLPAVALDLSAIEQELGSRIDAIIGLDLLSLQSFTIDYRTKRIRFGKVQSMQTSVPFRVAWEAGAPYLVVVAAANGQPVRLLVDLGANGLTLFESHTRALLVSLPAIGTRDNLNAGGAQKLREVELASLRLGKWEFGKRTALLMKLEAHDGREFDGLFGPRALGVKLLAFDFEQQLLVWER